MNTCCPVCTLYLREGITLQAHLETHPKEQVIEALLKVSNGGSMASSHHSASASVNPFMPIHSSSPYMSQTSPYVSPPTQLTTAVTYQHFMTSNGSTVMPHYIQVPASNPSLPGISNPAMNYVPNQTVNYAHTLYNPLYNPYIPQPYPFTQPLFTGYPISPLPPVDTNTQSVNPESSLSSTIDPISTRTIESSVAVKKCTIGTNTDGNKRVPKNSGPKKQVSKSPSSTTSTTTTTTAATTGKRSKMVKQKKTDSVVRRSLRIGLATNAKQTGVNKSVSTTLQAATTTTTTVIRTIRPKPSLATKTTPAVTKPPTLVTTVPRIISPPPLTLITSKTRSISDTKTPPPPPLAKAPFFIPQILNYIKSEDVPDCSMPHTRPGMMNDLSTGSNNLNVEYVGLRKKISTVIVDNSNSNDYRQRDESKESDEIIVDVVGSDPEASKDPLCTRPHDRIRIHEDTRRLKGCHEEVVVGKRNEVGETTLDDGERQEKVFHMIEVEDNKVEIADEVLSSEVTREIGGESIDKNREGSDLYLQEEDSQRERTEEYIEVDVVGTDSKGLDGLNERRTPSNDFSYFSSYDSARSVITEGARMGESSVKNTDNNSTLLSYSGLQPNTKNSEAFRELEISRSINFNNFMEMDSLKVLFKNQSTNYDPSMKVMPGVQPKTKNLTGFLKSEHQTNVGHTIVDSVIQIVSSTGESKSEFTFRDNIPATSSQVSECSPDRSEMSPLALNIQADESMPARGELSEQESLGAENSTWNLYHGNNAVDNMKTIEEWRNESTQSVSVIGTKKNSKAFRCSICNEMFSCPKERRVHKNTVHVSNTKSGKMEKGSPSKRAKNFECSFCSEVFSSVRDRKLHIVQNHVPGSKNKKNATTNSVIKKENAEPEYISLDESMTAVKNETEHEEKFKTESATILSSPTLPTPAGVDSQRVRFCTKCSLSFDGAKKFREHLRLAHGGIRFKCEKCSACFDEEPDFNDHLLIHPLECDKCGKTFHRKPNLNLHMKRHLEVKPYECSLCPKSFITRQKLDEHMNGHSGKKPIKCTLCDKTFSRHSNLVQHRNLHHFNVRKKLKDYVCRCGEVFHSMRKLEWHKEIHDPKPKPCPFCSQKFIHSASVTRHIRRSHIPEYLPGDNRELDNVNCPICEKVYLRSSLVVHLRVHNGEKPFQCKICNKRFSTKWNLELHNWTHQSRNNMPFKCHICKSAFFREPDFVAHLNSHRNYKPFTCNICGQKFIRKYSCLRHQEEHKKTKQFVCTVNGCEKRFHRGYYLRDHMKVHTGLRPHTCHICGKASSTKSNHNKHVRIHDTREAVNTEN